MSSSQKAALFENYVCVAFSIKLTVEGLHDFVTHSLEKIQTKIDKSLSKNRCTTNCGRRFRDKFSQWCMTCRCWKIKLDKLNKYPRRRINWNDIDTIDLPTSIEEIAKVFIKDFHHSLQHGLFKDLNSLMSLFQNMTSFNNVVSDSLITDVRRVRNAFYAHNCNLYVHETDKEQCILTLLALLRKGQIAATESSKRAIAMIEEMKTSNQIPEKYFNDFSELKLVIDEITTKNVSDDVPGYQEFLERFSSKALKNNEGCNNTGKNKSTVGRKTKLFQLILGFALFTLLFVPFDKDMTQKDRPEGCKSMRLENHWRSSLDFDSYVEDLKNQSTIERSWLEPKLKKVLDESGRGIFIAADMGFGKSSIISNILCAERWSVWYQLKQNVLGYHMCRHDVISSYGPEIFIQNLVGAIVENIQELGNSILSDDRALDFLYSHRCKEDPVACLEFSLLNPLKRKWSNRSFIVVIDAIDECISSRSSNLHEFLHKHILSFPKNIKFIVTSRKIGRLHENFKFLKFIDLTLYKTENLNDIKTYINEKANLDKDYVEKLLKVSDGNFLHAKLSLEYCIQTNSCLGNDIPDSLDRVYSLNLERIFGPEGQLFNKFYDLFAVLCSIHHPIEETKLLAIAGIDIGNRGVYQLLSNELGHFLNFENDTISFQHKSFVDFLTNKSRKGTPFYIEKEKGHQLFSKYLLNSINLTDSDHLASVVYHVALSRNEDLKSILIKHEGQLKNMSLESLYQLVHDYNSFDATVLMVELLNTTDNNVGLNAITQAAFLAVVKGNDEAFKALLGTGADIKYQRFVIFEAIPNDIVYICKYVYYCGYNYVHVAAQHGNEKLVKYLLHKDPTLIYTNTSLNRNAIQVAAENGHTTVLELILRFDSSLADFYSLYHSALLGQYQAVKMLLNYVQDECDPCVKYMHYYTILSTYSLGMSEIVKTKMRNVTLPPKLKGNVVIENSIACDSALCAAAKNRHLSIVKLLLRSSKIALNCSCDDLSIPIMQAIKNNDLQMFLFLFKEGSDILHVCKENVEVKISIPTLSSDNLIRKNESFCPKNAGIGHLLGIFDANAITEFIDEAGYILWHSKDAKGLTPIHYAFCHNNVRFIFYLSHGGNKSMLNVTLKSHNGSTPFHIAALCRSHVLFNNLLDLEQETSFEIIRSIYDSENRSVLQYSLLTPLEENDTEDVRFLNQDSFFVSLFHLVLSSGHDIFHTDKYGDNVLHYASKSGNYIALLTIFDNLHETQIDYLLRQKNNKGFTPFDIAFQSMPEFNTFQPLKLPYNCSLYCVFYTSCNISYDILLSPHESVIYIISAFIGNSSFKSMNITNLLALSLRKSRVYPILILRAFVPNQFLSALSNQYVLQLISKTSTPFLSQIIIHTEGALNCYGLDSPVHRVVQNKRSILWKDSLVSYLDILFEKFNSSYLDNCFDKEGFNLLHSAVTGGHPYTVKDLIERGMNPLLRTKAAVDILSLNIISAPFTNNGSLSPSYTNCSFYHRYKVVSDTEIKNITTYKENINFDETATFLLLELNKLQYFNDHNKRTLLCDRSGKRLGLVHLAAAKGMLSFLNTSNCLFGKELLQCQDYFGVSVSYLAYIYKQHHIVRWLEHLNVSQNKPSYLSQLVLLYNFIDNYSSKQRYDWRCLLLHRFNYEGLIRIQVKRCAFNDNHEEVFEQNPYKNDQHSMVLNVLASGRNLQDDIEEFERNAFPYNTYHKQLHKAVYNTLFIEHQRRFSILINYLELNKLYINHHLRHKHVLEMYRNLLLFGLHDKKFLFHKLLYHFGLCSNDEHFFVSKNNSIALFRAVFNNEYRHYSSLKMDTDVHRNWLYKFFNEVKDNFFASSVRKHELSIQDYFVFKWTRQTKLEEILNQIIEDHCDKCWRTIGQRFLVAAKGVFSKLKTENRVNKFAMKHILSCNFCNIHDIPTNVTMRRDFKIIVSLQLKEKEEVKPLLIEVEVLAKRVLKIIEGISPVHNADVKITDLFPDFYCMNTAMQMKALWCFDEYSKNEHLIAFKQFLRSLLAIMEETVSYEFFI